MTQVATILVKRQSDGYQLWGKRLDSGLYTTPSGRFEDEETPEQAAVRELFEEAGIVVNPDQLVKLGIREFPERNLTVHCFVVIVPDSVESSSANDPDHEVAIWEWLPTMPVDTHAKPNALAQYVKPQFTLRKLQTRAQGQVNFTVVQSTIAPTDNDKIFRFIASTNEVDRHGTRLLPRGCQHINFDKNPVFLWNHNKDGLPDDVIGRVFTLSVTDDLIVATVEFMTERPDGSRRERAWQCWQDVLAGILKAVSIGFIPLVESPVFKSPEESAKYLAGGGVIDVTQWDLCELSLCPIGSNPDALQVRKLSMRKRFTLARRDVVDSSGHKHAANGQFGSGGGSGAKPRKKLGNAAEKHSAAAHETKTHEAHSKAGKAHAAVARAALKRGDTDKAASALAQAKTHRDEAKRLRAGGESKDATKADGTSKAKLSQTLINKYYGHDAEAKNLLPQSEYTNLGSISKTKNPHALDIGSQLADLRHTYAKEMELDPKTIFTNQSTVVPEIVKKYIDDPTVSSGKPWGFSYNGKTTILDGNHRVNAALITNQPVTADIIDLGKVISDAKKELAKQGKKTNDFNSPIFENALRRLVGLPEYPEPVKGKRELVNRGLSFTLTRTPANTHKLVGVTIQSAASDDDDVEPDDSVDLDAEIEELEALLAQKRYQAKPFTIRHVPIPTKG